MQFFVSFQMLLDRVVTLDYLSSSYGVSKGEAYWLLV